MAAGADCPWHSAASLGRPERVVPWPESNGHFAELDFESSASTNSARHERRYLVWAAGSRNCGPHRDMTPGTLRSQRKRGLAVRPSRQVIGRTEARFAQLSGEHLAGVGASIRAVLVGTLAPSRNMKTNSTRPPTATPTNDHASAPPAMPCRPPPRRPRSRRSKEHQEIGSPKRKTHQPLRLVS